MSIVLGVRQSLTSDLTEPTPLVRSRLKGAAEVHATAMDGGSVGFAGAKKPIDRGVPEYADGLNV